MLDKTNENSRYSAASDEEALPALPSRRSSARNPKAEPAIDSFVDDVLPRAVFSAFRPDSGTRTLTRALSDGERSAVARRIGELEAALLPYRDDEKEMVEAQIKAMFSGFRAMRQIEDEAVATASIAANVLADLPLWAIARACLKIARGKAGLDKRYAPNDAQIYGIADDLLQPYRAALDRARKLLTAKLECVAPSQDDRDGLLRRYHELTARLSDSAQAQPPESQKEDDRSSERARQADLVAKWNEKNGVGAPVRIKDDRGNSFTAATRSAAILIGGRATIWVDGCSGPVNLDEIEPAYKGGDGDPTQ